MKQPWLARHLLGIAVVLMESERAAWAPLVAAVPLPSPLAWHELPAALPPTLVSSWLPKKHLSIPLLFFLLAEPECNLKQKSLCPRGLALPVSSPSPEPCCDLQRHFGVESWSWR